MERLGLKPYSDEPKEEPVARKIEIKPREITLNIEVVMPSWGVLGWRKFVGVRLIALAAWVMGVAHAIQVSVEKS